MRIFNYAKKEKKLLGFELNDVQRFGISIAKSKERFYDTDKTLNLIDLGPDSEKVKNSGLTYDQFKVNFEKYIKWIKRNEKLDDVLFGLTTGAMIGCATYIAYRIGVHEGIANALNSDSHKFLRKAFNDEGKRKLMDEILNAAKKDPAGFVIAYSPDSYDPKEAIGYLVTQYVTEKPDNFIAENAIGLISNLPITK